MIILSSSRIVGHLRSLAGVLLHLLLFLLLLLQPPREVFLPVLDAPDLVLQVGALHRNLGRPAKAVGALPKRPRDQQTEPLERIVILGPLHVLNIGIGFVLASCH